MTAKRLFPAWAGVIPVIERARAEADPFPRMGGGDPMSPSPVRSQSGFSPQGRG